jgi:transcriptional regulator with XRE-family HTH domain
MTTYYVATNRHGQKRTFHTDRDCPALDRATGVRTRDRESIPDEQTCVRCRDEAYWNQGGSDWSYQNALREAADDEESELVTDGGTVLACPNCDSARLTTVQHNLWGGEPAGEGSHYCKDCNTHVDPVERESYRSDSPRRGLAKRLADADPDDLVTDGGTITVCPECDTPQIRRRTPDHPASASSSTKRWYCLNCQRSFDEPDERAPQATTGARSGLARKLDEADPGDLVTDGGVPDPDAFQMPTITDLDAMRTALNLGQRELSRRAGLEPSRFNHILHNDVDPHASTLRAFLGVLQDAEPRTDDEIERAGPKPEPSPNADHDPDDYELLSAQLHHSPPDAVGEDPRPPERERDEGLRTDGGERLRSKADANTGALTATGVVGWPTEEKEYVDLGERLNDGDALPDPDRSEQARRARQAAHSLVAWSRRADLDPGDVLAEVREGLPRTDGGEKADHFCEICERPFETIAALIKHDCEERDAPLVTDGGDSA